MAIFKSLSTKEQLQVALTSWFLMRDRLITNMSIEKLCRLQDLLPRHRSVYGARPLHTPFSRD